MSLAKALPNRPRRKSQEDRPPGFVRSNVLQRMPVQKIGLARNTSSQPGVAIPIKLAPVIIGIMMSVITMSAVPIVRAIIRSGIIPVRRIVTVGIISVIARTEPDTEVKLSIRTRRPCKHQTPNYDCNQQKFLHGSPPDNLTGGPVESSVGYSHAGTLG